MAMELPVVRPPPLTLEAAIDEIDRLWDKVEELQDITRDLTDRMTDFEHFLARLALPTVEVTLPRYELERLIPPTVRGSRWVLELFPDEIEEWRRAIRTIPTEHLTERERSFLRALDYYIASERKLTIPQLGWLSAIQRKAGGIVPEVPVPTASNHHSNPNQRRYGKPKTDVERIMAHYRISKEEAERLISETMMVYGVGREEAIKALLPPRGAKVKGSSNAERVAYWEVVYWTPEKPETKFRRPFPIDQERAKVWKKMLEERGYEARIMPVYEKASSNQKQCRICFYPLPEGAEKCPRCLSPVKKE